MTRKLKALGTALVAAFAMSAVAAAAASAQEHDFTSTKEATVITAVGNNATFGTKTSILEVTCEEERFNGTQVDLTADEITVHPEYDKCTAEPFGPAEVVTTGCDYVLDSDTVEHEGTGAPLIDAPVDVECTGGNQIEIIAEGCTIFVGSQQDLLGVTYENQGDNVKVDATVDKIHFTTTNQFACVVAGLPATGNDGTLTGSAVASGFEDLEEDPVEPHQFVFNHGNQVDIGVE